MVRREHAVATAMLSTLGNRSKEQLNMLAGEVTTGIVTHH